MKFGQAQMAVVVEVHQIPQEEAVVVYPSRGVEEAVWWNQVRTKLEELQVQLQVVKGVLKQQQDQLLERNLAEDFVLRLQFAARVLMLVML